eukprot:28515-Chlamydomonas_euryale.AAC.1
MAALGGGGSGGGGVEERLVAWARSVGFAPQDACLSRGGVSRLARGPAAAAFWDFAAHNLHAKEARARLRAAAAGDTNGGAAPGTCKDERRPPRGGDTVGADGGDDDDTEAARDARVLRRRAAVLPTVSSTNETLRRMRDARAKRLEERLRSSAELEARSEAARDALVDARCRQQLLSGYSARVGALLPALRGAQRAVDAVHAWAARRATAAVPGGGGSEPSDGGAVAEALYQLQARVIAAWCTDLTPPVPATPQQHVLHALLLRLQEAQERSGGLVGKEVWELSVAACAAVVSGPAGEPAGALSRLLSSVMDD